MQQVQKENGLEIDEELDTFDFSVEMETDTGKTYVYLKSIYELHKAYGFKTFVKCYSIIKRLYHIGVYRGIKTCL